MTPDRVPALARRSYPTLNTHPHPTGAGGPFHCGGPAEESWLTSPARPDTEQRLDLGDLHERANKLAVRVPVPILLTGTDGVWPADGQCHVSRGDLVAVQPSQPHPPRSSVRCGLCRYANRPAGSRGRTGQ